MMCNEKIVQNADFKAEKLKGDIVFANVGFSYKKGNEVLKNLSFKINAGQTIAIVGATGSGKTSIINLLISSDKLKYNTAGIYIIIINTDFQNISK